MSLLHIMAVMAGQAWYSRRASLGQQGFGDLHVDGNRVAKFQSFIAILISDRFKIALLSTI